MSKNSLKAKQLRYLHKMGCWWNKDHWRVIDLHHPKDVDTREEAIAHLKAMEKKYGSEWWLRTEEICEKELQEEIVRTHKERADAEEAIRQEVWRTRYMKEAETASR